MIIIPFFYINGLVAIDCKIQGLQFSSTVTMAVDTGAVTTTISSNVLDFIKCNDAGNKYHKIISVSGELSAKLVTIPTFHIFNETLLNFPVLSHLLPDGVQIDGLLGLDFFEGKILEIDFPNQLLKITK